MKWHDENPERWQEHMVMSAINQNFSLASPEETPWVSEAIQRLESKGLIRPTHYWEWTETGEKAYVEVCKEMLAARACEAEQP